MAKKIDGSTRDGYGRALALQDLASKQGFRYSSEDGNSIGVAYDVDKALDGSGISIYSRGIISYPDINATNFGMTVPGVTNDLYNKGITVLSIQPGWVQTDMGGPEAPLTPEESISKIIKLVNVKGIDDSGKFFTQDGLELPW